MIKVFFAKLWSEHSLYYKDAKSLYHIQNWLMNFKEFTFIGLLRIYQAIVIDATKKKRKLKLLKTWSYTQVVIFWLLLEKVVFKLENVNSKMNTDHLWGWKLGVFLQSTGSKNLRTLLLIRWKAGNLAERKAESNSNILFNKIWVFVFLCCFLQSCSICSIQFNMR